MSLELGSAYTPDLAENVTVEYYPEGIPTTDSLYTSDSKQVLDSNMDYIVFSTGTTGTPTLLIKAPVGLDIIRFFAPAELHLTDLTVNDTTYDVYNVNGKKVASIDLTEGLFVMFTIDKKNNRSYWISPFSLTIT